MENFTARNFMKALRCIHNSYGESLLKRTCVVRQITTWKPGANQEARAYLCYDKAGAVIVALESFYLNYRELELSLPNRIPIFRDLTPLSNKDFDIYMNSATYTTYEKDSLLWDFAK